jgi:hypothetical protein
VPDELTQPGLTPAAPVRDAPAPPAVPPAAPPVANGTAAAAGGGPSRRPSWLRAAVWSLVILAAGTALGAAGYRLERTYLVQPPSVLKTAGDWHLSARPGHDLSGLGLSGRRLIWQDGASIEYLDLDEGTVRLLGPGAGMRATWDPAISTRYAVWFEAERPASVAAQAVAYDTVSGRRWTLGTVGSVRSFPALSGDLAVWCSAVRLGRPQILGARIGGTWAIPIADGDGAPVVSGGLVVWASSWTGPFVAKDITSGVSWPVAASLTSGKLTGMALGGSTLVWGQAGTQIGSGVVAAVDVDGGGGQQTIASGVTGLAGPSYDGKTVVWAESSASGSRVMARLPNSGAAVVVARVDGAVTEVAVSDGTAAWIEKDAGSSYSIVVRRLPR